MSDQLSIEDKLQQCLGPEWISNRVGHGGSKLMYLEGKTAINLANEIFGYNGWSSEVKDSQVDFFDTTDDGRVSLGISTTVRITLKDGTFHEDIGYGVSENSRTKAAAFEKARKESATDGMKRALRIFGNAVGNCIYDKGYLRNVGNMSKPPIPFIPLELYRHPHVRKTIEEQMKRSSENRPTAAASSSTTSSSHPSHPAPGTVAATTTNTTMPPTKQQQSVAKTSTTPKQAAPTPTTSSHSAYKNDPAVSEMSPAKRQFDDDFGPEIFAEDSFIIDDEDDDFYAQVADYRSMPLSPPPSLANNQSSASSDQSTKRQRQQ